MSILCALSFCFCVIASGSCSDLAFYVGSHGWHTSIIVPRAEIPKGLWPRDVAEQTFARYRYLELGWGDRKFYMAPHPGIAMAFDAAALPGPSVLHVVGLNPPLARALPWSALVRVTCSRTEFVSLCRALGDSFERDNNSRALPLGRGLYGETSRFYAARGRYYFMNTCDTWTARMMRAGGLPADTSLIRSCSAGAIIVQARRLTAQRSTRAETIASPRRSSAIDGARP
ncbi:MAG: DUF2459 domain-containing protein [Spartobacteria bacterium]